MSAATGPGALAALALAAVLLVPGPASRRLLLAGAHLGPWRAIPLLAAHWLACCLAIGTWCTALGLMASVLPWAPAAAQVSATGYVLWTAARCRRKAPCRESSAAGMFPIALIDPPALFCAAVVFPPLGAAAPAVAMAYLTLTALLLPIGACWILGGAVAARQAVPGGAPPVRRRMVALLGAFSGTLATLPSQRQPMS
jgi:threonine/homoserine/homoserine lactone efflux protein